LPTPTYRGIKPTAPIPVELHVRNEGGSDRQGLCVISSVLAAGMAQGVPGLNIPGYDERTGRNMPGKGSALWREAKSQPGGYSPDKLAALLNRIMPGEKWTSYIGTDPREIEKLIKQGYRVCSTMSRECSTGCPPPSVPVAFETEARYGHSLGCDCRAKTEPPPRFCFWQRSP
jgi:hypothetical protein